MMPSNQQYRDSQLRSAPRRRSPTPGLMRNPQKKAICLKTIIITPKKPNSARRKAARVRLSDMHQIDRRLIVYIPGVGHSLQEHGSVLVQGGGVPDLPGVHYRLIRGKYDLAGVVGRSKSRSKYGVRRRVGTHQ